MSDVSEGCLFCKIARHDLSAKLVFEDDDVVAFEDINPQAPTHILVIPRRHVASLDELGPDDAAMVGAVVARASRIARERELQEGGYRVVINCGEGAGQSVFHIHAHLLGGRAFSWPPG